MDDNPDRAAGIGIIGHGETIEVCFANVANAMFSLMADISNIHQIQIITFEFEEANIENALVIWLNLLLEKAKEHHLIFGDFRLKREEKMWRATVAGEPERVDISRGVEVKSAKEMMSAVIRTDHSWEARCVVDI